MSSEDIVLTLAAALNAHARAVMNRILERRDGKTVRRKEPAADNLASPSGLIHAAAAGVLTKHLDTLRAKLAALKTGEQHDVLTAISSSSPHSTMRAFLEAHVRWKGSSAAAPTEAPATRMLVALVDLSEGMW